MALYLKVQKTSYFYCRNNYYTLIKPNKCGKKKNSDVLFYIITFSGFKKKLCFWSISYFFFFFFLLFSIIFILLYIFFLVFCFVLFSVDLYFISSINGLLFYTSTLLNRSLSLTSGFPLLVNKR